MHEFAPGGLFPRKAKKRPCGWKISLGPCWRLLDFSPGRPKNGLSDGRSLSAHVRACWTFPPEGQNRPFGWKISLSTCSRLPDFSPGRPENGLSDGKSLSAHVRACRTFPPEGPKTAFRMELCFFCACGGGRLLCEERRRAPAARYMTGLVYTIACHSLFPGAYAPIASLAPAVLYEFFRPNLSLRVTTARHINC